MSPKHPPSARRPDPPAELPPAGKALWKKIVADYPPKHFRAANLELLANFVRAWLHAAECDAAIATHGLLIGGKANPAVAMRAHAWSEMRAIATKLRLAIETGLHDGVGRGFQLVRSVVTPSRFGRLLGRRGGRRRAFRTAPSAPRRWRGRGRTHDERLSSTRTRAGFAARAGM